MTSNNRILHSNASDFPASTPESNFTSNQPYQRLAASSDYYTNSPAPFCPTSSRRNRSSSNGDTNVLPASDPDSSINGDLPVSGEYKVYPIRWLMLAVLASTSAVNAINWVAFAPISDKVRRIDFLNTLISLFQFFLFSFH